MEPLQTKYITPDDFKNYWGIDLACLDDGDDPSNKKTRFIQRIEDRIAMIVDSSCFKQVDREYPAFSEYQKQHYKLALLEQAMYVFHSGDIQVDSGIDPERGVVITPEQIAKTVLSPMAKRHLMLCGIWSKKIRMSDWVGNLEWWR